MNVNTDATIVLCLTQNHTVFDVDGEDEAEYIDIEQDNTGDDTELYPEEIFLRCS